MIWMIYLQPDPAHWAAADANDICGNERVLQCRSRGGLLTPHRVEKFCVGLGFFEFIHQEFNGSDIVHVMQEFA